MITLKSRDEITAMQIGGGILKRVLKEVVAEVKDGITTRELDSLADILIQKYGGYPGFKHVQGYKYATCICVNEQLVHTEPSARILKKGDVVTIDAGVYYEGLHTDSAETVIVENVHDVVKINFLNAGKEAVKKAITLARPGNYIGNISQKLEEIITGSGYFVVNELTGHGVGRELHEDPLIPGFVDGDIEKTPKIKPGMTLAIEIIYSMGTNRISYEKGSKWSIKTRDNSLGACFEHTIAILEKNTLILT